MSSSSRAFIFACIVSWSTPSIADGGLPPKLPDGRQRAFPTAEGFGAGAKGGRGGKIIYVTNTRESGDGSLRACIEALEPRTCVFRTGGTIVLNDASLVIRNPYITIAGETAPGGGIAIRNTPVQIRPSVEIMTHDVIIRHLRIRPGPHVIESCCSGALGLYSEEAHDIMLDHISASWGSDETVDSQLASNFTWQWGIASEPLYSGGPGKKRRARNMLLTKSGSMTIHHSLFSQGVFRNPQIELKVPNSVADVVNNVMFSRQWQYVVSFDDRETHIRANVVGNYKTKGKVIDSDYLIHPFVENRHGYSLFVKDNFDETYRTNPTEPDDVVLAPQHRDLVVATPFPAPPVRTTAPEKAYEEVLAKAGATKPARDAVDQRVVKSVMDRSGRILKNDPNTVGGWPELDPGTPYADSDQDGIDDAWEISQGFNPNDASDGQQDKDGDGWTNFEEFTHMLAGD
jgi:hypothetical protein